MLTSRTTALHRLSLPAPHPTSSYHGETEQPLRLTPCYFGEGGGLLSQSPPLVPSPPFLSPLASPSSLHLSLLMKWVHTRRPVSAYLYMCGWVCVCCVHVHSSPSVTATGMEGAKALTQWLVPPPPRSSLLVSAGKYKEWEKSPHYKLLKGQGQAPVWIASKSRIVESHS